MKNESQEDLPLDETQKLIERLGLEKDIFLSGTRDLTPVNPGPDYPTCSEIPIPFARIRGDTFILKDLDKQSLRDYHERIKRIYEEVTK